MRRGLLGAVVAAVAACALAPSAQGAREVDLHITGGVSVTWHGGAYSGSATLPIGTDDETVDLESGNSSGASLSPPQPVIVRVARRDAAGSTAGVCLDSLPAGESPVTIEPVQGGLRIAVAQAGGEFLGPIAGAISSGRCAGPRTSDLTRLLPAATFGPSRLSRSGSVLDLSGARAWSAGSFSGTVVSTVSATVLRGSPRTSEPEYSSRDLRTRTRVHRLHVLVARILYRIPPAVASFDTILTDVGAPVCRGFDVCGARGSLAYSFTTRGGTLEFDGSAVLRGAPPRHLPAALAYIARHGRFDGYTELREHSGQTVERLAGGGASCSDTVPARAPALDAGSHAGRVLIRLAPPSEVFEDQFRTRCPGPTQADVVDSRPIATASFPVAALGARRMRVALRGGRAFSSGPFFGSYSGGVVLQLRRAHTVLRSEHVRENVEGRLR